MTKEAKGHSAENLEVVKEWFIRDPYLAGSRGFLVGRIIRSDAVTVY